jgi:hypothetical protein
MTTRSSRVPTSTLVEEPGTTETGVSSSESASSEVPTKTTSRGGGDGGGSGGASGGAVGPTGGNGGNGGSETPGPTISAIPNDAARIGGSMEGVLGLVMFVVGFVMFG